MDDESNKYYDRQSGEHANRSIVDSAGANTFRSRSSSVSVPTRTVPTSVVRAIGNSQPASSRYIVAEHERKPKSPGSSARAADSARRSY